MKAIKEETRRLSLPTDLTPEEYVRCLVGRGQQLVHEYYETDAPWSGPEWWLTFNEVGTRLYEALENGRIQGNLQQMSNQEQEHAYMLLIRVAYFFEPGGVAESFFQEQGWLRKQTSQEDSALPKISAKRTLQAVISDQVRAIRVFVQKAFQRDSRWHARFVHPQNKPDLPVVPPVSPSYQETSIMMEQHLSASPRCIAGGRGEPLMD